MSIFLSIAGLMVAVALAWLLPTLLKRQRSVSATTEAASNLSILRDQLAELERDLARGTLSQAHYQQARDDFDRRVLEELSEPGSRAAVAGSGRRIALVLGLLMPLCAGLLYWQIGSLPGLENGSAAPHAGKVSPEQVEAMVAKLAARLEQAPEDADGWALLGRSYMTMQRYDQAAKAYERATSLIKNNADLYADYADALAMAQGRRIDGKPLKLVEEALRVDPNHWKALAIAGSAAFERKDYKAATGYWEKLLARVGPETEFGRSVASNLDEARQLAGIAAPVAKNGAPVAAGKAASAAKESQKEPAAGGGRLSGTVRLSPALAGKAAPEDTVFIFARAVQGSRMPLAIVRRQVKDLPYSFVLDDSQAMSPEMKLSKFAEVVVGARISKAGSAVPQSGDLQGASKAVKVGSKDVTVVIDAAVP